VQERDLYGQVKFLAVMDYLALNFNQLFVAILVF
jgi:hypothetical protein